jgi:hypothetical protein
MVVYGFFRSPEDYMIYVDVRVCEAVYRIALML